MSVDVNVYAGKLHVARRAVQIFTLVLLVVIPLSGMFRIDPVDGAFVVGSREIWFSDMFIVLGFWIFVASLLVMFYSLVGAAFCGWMCPQNSVSEWANRLTQRLLGRNARIMDMTGDAMLVALRRSSWRNKALLFSILLAASMVIALVPLLYFYPPSAIWSFLTLSEDTRLAGSLHWIYTICVAVVFLDVAVVRHLMCRYMCIYRVWQHSFKTRDTVRIQYDASRKEDCSNCNYCADHCFVDIDPRDTVTFDSCVNCGECIAACDTLHHKSSKLDNGSLLSFVAGRGATAKPLLGSLGGLMLRAKTALLFTLLGGGMLGFGLLNYQPELLSVSHAESLQDHSRLVYRVEVAHKLFAPVEVKLRVDGLPQESFQLAQDTVVFDHPGRKYVALTLSPQVSKGLHRFRVVAQGDNGWSKVFNVVHYAAGGV